MNFGGNKYVEMETDTDTAVKAVKGGVEVEPWSQAVHLQEHLSQEQSKEKELCIVWNRNKNRN